MQNNHDIEKKCADIAEEFVSWKNLKTLKEELEDRKATPFMLMLPASRLEEMRPYIKGILTNTGHYCVYIGNLEYDARAKAIFLVCKEGQFYHSLTLPDILKGYDKTDINASTYPEPESHDPEAEDIPDKFAYDRKDMLTHFLEVYNTNGTLLATDNMTTSEYENALGFYLSRKYALEYKGMEHAVNFYKIGDEVNPIKKIIFKKHVIEIWEGGEHKCIISK